MTSPPIIAMILPKLTSFITIAPLLEPEPVAVLALALPVVVLPLPTLTLPVAILVPVKVVTAEDVPVDFPAAVGLPLIATGP
jgi:hypothetical protein